MSNAKKANLNRPSPEKTKRPSNAALCYMQDPVFIFAPRTMWYIRVNALFPNAIGKEKRKERKKNPPQAPVKCKKATKYNNNI